MVDYDAAIKSLEKRIADVELARTKHEDHVVQSLLSMLETVLLIRAEISTLRAALDTKLDS